MRVLWWSWANSVAKDSLQNQSYCCCLTGGTRIELKVFSESIYSISLQLLFWRVKKDRLLLVSYVQHSLCVTTVTFHFLLSIQSFRRRVTSSLTSPTMSADFFILSSEYFTKSVIFSPVFLTIWEMSNSFNPCFDAIQPFQLNYNQVQYPHNSQTSLMIPVRLLLRTTFSFSKFNPQTDYYKILGLAKNAQKGDIRNAFKELAKKYHPDYNQKTEEKFKQVNQAYQILSNQETKKQYDQSRQSQPRKHSDFGYSPHSNTHQQNSQSSKQQHFYTKEELHEHLRRQNEEMMRRYQQQRKDYDHLGRGYDNYQRFTQETLRKKAQQYKQKDRVTQESVRKQEELRRKQQELREEAYYRQKQEEVRQALRQKYRRGRENGEAMVSGFKKMGEFVKDMFRKK